MLAEERLVTKAKIKRILATYVPVFKFDEYLFGH